MFNLVKIPDLIPGKIDVWLFDIDRTLSEIEEFKAILSSEERTRAKRFKFLNDRHRYVVQHGMLRVLLSGYMKKELQQVEIRTSLNGKPYVTSQDRGAIHFSASRSDEFAMLAFSCIDSIGIDIEKIRNIPDIFEIVERHFTHNEKKKILLCPEKSRLELFYKLFFPRKKAHKCNLSVWYKTMNCVNVAMSTDTFEPWKVQVGSDPVAEEFWVMDVVGPAGYAAAVAATCPFDPVLARHSWEENIKNPFALE